jgi:TRAP-type mannitol/chloroaromatic compound transport system permease large subunit
VGTARLLDPDRLPELRPTAEHDGGDNAESKALCTRVVGVTALVVVVTALVVAVVAVVVVGTVGAGVATTTLGATGAAGAGDATETGAALLVATGGKIATGA